jgi:hypothetical protein
MQLQKTAGEGSRVVVSKITAALGSFFNRLGRLSLRVRLKRRTRISTFRISRSWETPTGVTNREADSPRTLNQRVSLPIPPEVCGPSLQTASPTSM